MKKRIISLAIGMMACSGVYMYAQDAPYTQMNQLADPTAYTDTVTTGVAVPYFVMPDPVLNDAFLGTYDPSLTNAVNDLESEWTWFKGDGDLTGGIVPATGDADAPYVQVTWTGTGGDSDTLWVREDIEMGSSGSMCEGDSSWIEVVVVDEPFFVVRPAGDNVVYHCGNTTEDLTIDSVANNLVRGGNFYFDYDIVIDNLNADLSLDANVSTDNNVYDTVARPAGALPYEDLVMIPMYDFNLLNSKITRYTFTLNGVNDHISRKSDFLSLTDQSGETVSEYTFYTPESGGGEETDIIVYVFPRPETGDIFYIPNDFNK